MTPTAPATPVIYTLTTAAEIKAAVEDLVKRSNDLPPEKRGMLRGIMADRPDLEIETISLLVLMLENSDEDGNITDPALAQMIEDAQKTVGETR